MSRRLIRARHPRTRTAVLAAALLASAVGLPPAATAQASPIVGIDQLDITPNWRAVPRHDVVTAVGATGYAHATETAGVAPGGPLEWTDFASGARVPLGYGAYEAGHGTFAEAGTGGRRLVVRRGGVPYVRDLTAGTEQALSVPSDARYRALLGETLLFQRYASAADTTTTTGFLLRSAADQAAAPVTVTGWPAGADLDRARLVAGDASVAVLRFGRVPAPGPDGTPEPYAPSDLGVVDLSTGQMTVVPAPAPDGNGVAVSPDKIAWVDGSRTVHVRERAALGGAEQTFALPEGLSATRVALVGEWVLALGDATGADASLRRRLDALHPDGRTQRIADRAEGELTQLPGGGAAFVGGTSATDWSLLKAIPGKSGGAPAVEKLRRVEPLEARVDALALGSGRLSTLEPDTGKAGFHSRTLPVGPVHTGQSGPAYAGAETGRLEATTPLFDSGDGRTVHLARATATGSLDVVARRANGTATRVATGRSEGRIADVFGRWAVFQTGLATAQGQVLTGQDMLVVDLDTARTVRTVTQQSAAALWGDTLYTPTPVTGEVGRVDLVTGKDLGRIATGATCRPTELQTAGRWLYWACAGYTKQGVYDLVTRKAVPLAAGVATGALLGDGYLIERGTDGYLRITDFHTDRAAAVRRFVDATQVAAARRVAWTVDRFGGAVAYKDARNLVHTVWTNVPTSDLTAPSSGAPATALSKNGWKASWTLSKPASNWELTLRYPVSWTVIRTYRANETRGRVDAPVWDGRTASGSPVANGSYAWELTARTADGKGRDLSLTGTVKVSGGQPAWRDLAGKDGAGDLIVMDTTGVVSLYRGTAYGTLSARIAGSGVKFPTASLFVPSGDVNADGCADVLVRVRDELRSYRPGCDKVLSGASPYTLVGTGWAQYDTLTSPGDINGDGFADLVARQTTTGDVYMFGGTADHRLKPRIRIGTNWKVYKKIVGAGDMNRDGRADLIAVDGTGYLWRYRGTATGGVLARERIGSGWNMYSSVTGVGDISGDACPDVVGRDTTGSLYVHQGTCGSGYGSRYRLGGGWNVYKGLY
ncbi:FG-GAP-like repeat-containing protein [Streptomyces sp. NPDC020807]|uniref:FG-GAP-like repeat-containing protein n=1 Tax=Streptomyces sp. NPDC020807 TaxID=3155119 RepID=UPI0033EF1456